MIKSIKLNKEIWERENIEIKTCDIILEANNSNEKTITFTDKSHNIDITSKIFNKLQSFFNLLCWLFSNNIRFIYELKMNKNNTRIIIILIIFMN